MSRSRCLSALLVGLGIAVCSTALAQPDAGDAEKRGKAKFEAGHEALTRGKVEEALSLFQESWVLHGSPGAMLNIARCEEKLGRVASAFRHYQAALASLPAEDKRIPGVKELLVRIEPRVPKVRVLLDSGTPASAKISMDDVEVTRAELTSDIPVDPGKHTIVVQAPGFVKRSYDIELSEGEKVTAVVGPGAAEPTKTEPLAVKAPDDVGTTRPFPTKTAVLVGGGVVAAVGIGVGIAGLVISDEKRGERDTVCGVVCLQPGEPAYEEQKSFWKNRDDERVAWGNTGIAGFIAGGIALAATTVVFFAWKPKAAVSDRGPREVTKKAPGEVSFAPSGAGAIVRFTW